MLEALPNEIIEKIVYFTLEGSINSLKNSSSLMLVNKRINQISHQVMNLYTFKAITYNYNTYNVYKNLLTRFHKLEIGSIKIHLTHMEQLESLLNMAPTLTSLQIFDVSDSLANYDNLEFLGTFSNLKKLSIVFQGIAYIEDEWMSQLANVCPHLQHLEVKKDSIQASVDPSLYFLNFTATALNTLSTLSLKHIGIVQSDIDSCEELQDCNFSQVETLDLSSSAILSNDIFDSLINFPKLKKLILNQRNVDGNCIDPWWIEEHGQKPFDNFPYIPTLETLSFLDHAFVCLDDFVDVKQLFHIKSLAVDVPGTHSFIGTTPIPEETREKAYIDFAANYKKMSDLTLCFEIEKGLGNSSCKYLKHLAKMANLQHLTISNAAFKENEFQTMSQNVAVETLTFHDVTASVNAGKNLTPDLSNVGVKNIRINKSKDESPDFNISNLLLLVSTYFPNIEKIILNLDYFSLANFDTSAYEVIKKLQFLKFVVLNEGQDTQKVFCRNEINDWLISSVSYHPA